MANAVDDTTTDEKPEAKGDSKHDDAEFDKRVNAAVSSHTRRLEKRFNVMLDEKLSALGGAKPAVKDEGDEDEGKPAARATRKESEPDPELARMKRELAEIKRSAVEKEAAAELKASLAGKIKPEAMDAAVKLARSRIVVKKGEAVFTSDEGDEISIAEGVAEWLRSPEGALFAPPPAPNRDKGRKPSYGPVPGARRVVQGGTDDLPSDPAKRTAVMLARLGKRV